MNKFFFIYFAFFFLMGCAYGKPKRDNTYYAYKIVGEVIDEAKQKHGLETESVGGSFWEGVSLLSIGFGRYKTMDEEDAKAILLDLANNLVDRVNRHEKIRSFLKNYPFELKNVSVSIGFSDENGQHLRSEQLTYILLVNGEMTYWVCDEKTGHLRTYKREVIVKNEKTDTNNE